MTGTIDITCSLPAPTLAQVRAWLTRTGWDVDTSPLAHALQECWSHPVHGRAWLPREELNDWLTYITNWIASRAWQLDATPEAVYREIMGPTKVWRVEGYDCAWSTPEKARELAEEVGARAYEIEVHP